MNDRRPRAVPLLAVCILALMAGRAHAASASERAKAVRQRLDAFLAGNAGFAQGVPMPAPTTAPMSAATGQDHLDFQWMLYSMALEPEDRAFCDGRVGAENPSNEEQYRACRVTRNFLWYIKMKPDGVEGRFPPLADIRYARTKAETDELFRRLEDASK